MFYKIYPCVTSVLSSLFKRTDTTGFLFLKNSFEIRFELGDTNLIMVPKFHYTIPIKKKIK